MSEKQILRENPLEIDNTPKSMGIDNTPIIKPFGFELRYIGADGKEYPTAKAAYQAKMDMLRYKSSVLGREYPATLEGAEAMRRDEAAYRVSQKIVKNKLG